MSIWIETPLNAVILASARVNPQAVKGEAHITLAHFDKSDPETFAAVSKAAENACIGLDPLRGELSGVGTFYFGSYRQPVVLVNSLDLCELWHRLRTFLRGEGVEPDAKYGFQPHITMDQKVVGTGEAIAGTFRVHRFQMSMVRVVRSFKQGGDKQREHHDIALGAPTVAFARAVLGETVHVETPSQAAAKLDLSDTEV